MPSVQDSYVVDLLPGLAALARFGLHVEVDPEASCAASPDCAVVYLMEEGQAPPGPAGWSTEALARADFHARLGQTLRIPAPDGSLVVLAGLGTREEPDGHRACADPDAFREAGAAAARAASARADLCLALPSEMTGDDITALVEGVLLGRYRFNTSKSNARHREEAASPEPGAVDLVRLTLVAPNAERALVRASARRAEVLVRAAYIARDLTNAPPAHLTPSTLADQAAQLSHRYGFEAEIWDSQTLAALGCGGIIGVNRGSEHQAQLIKLRYVPSTTMKNDRLALVGKGITFDSGGLSLKPATSMRDMKTDMGGAAAILGAFCAFADLGVGTEVEAWLPTTDNMISGNSLRVSEVLTARNGTTVEVINTDAEGRLILMDALSLAAESNPTWIVDIATLTGAQLVALGEDLAALLGTDRSLLGHVEKAAEATGEAVWELPLHRRYLKILDSAVADIANANLSRRFAGTITASLFLSTFVDGISWAHIDIASPSISASDDRWLTAGATGFGARLLAQLAQDLSE